MLTVRWYLRYNLSYGISKNSSRNEASRLTTSPCTGVKHFTPLLIDAAGPCRHRVGRRWFVDETYVKSEAYGGTWTGPSTTKAKCQVIDVFVSPKPATKFFTAALLAHGRPVEVVRDKAAALANVVEKLLPNVFHNTEQYANNRVDCDHGQLKARLRQCANSRPTEEPESQFEVTCSSRTFDADTTNSEPKVRTLIYALPPHSTNSA